MKVCSLNFDEGAVPGFSVVEIMLDMQGAFSIWLDVVT